MVLTQDGLPDPSILKIDSTGTLESLDKLECLLRGTGRLNQCAWKGPYKLETSGITDGLFLRQRRRCVPSFTSSSCAGCRLPWTPYPEGMYPSGDVAGSHTPLALAGIFVAVLMFLTIYVLHLIAFSRTRSSPRQGANGRKPL